MELCLQRILINPSSENGSTYITCINILLSNVPYSADVNQTEYELLPRAV